jgi:hypothetical protein
MNALDMPLGMGAAIMTFLVSHSLDDVIKKDKKGLPKKLASCFLVIHSC